ncbi:MULTISPECIES: HEPN domain-containing protein [unclassified Pantoea]|uniref:HEPN domain-containing protein n=1 Tax=unclassified Pantoea TaxID=2630326 RepID=UPI0021188BD0|nr:MULTISPECIES: HEPN domain-containing protein [unclassified Pantoea]
MMTNSKAFEVLKGQTQSSLDFAVLCCNAVPALKGYIKALEAEKVKKLPNADYFKGDPNLEQLKSFSTSYKKNLGKLLFINTFSYFESYFKELISEIKDFHGGKDSFKDAAIKKRKQHILFSDRTETSAHANKLREYKKGTHLSKYRKHISALEHTDFRFPSEMLSTFGLIELFGSYSDLKASQIPYVAEHAFGVEFSKNEIEEFSKLRDLRNKIAHGKVSQVEFKKAIEMNYFMRQLALKIDKHVVKHFLVIEFI